MTGASRHVFLSQSTISFQIGKLEEIVKCPLFKRDGRRISLSPQGLIFYDYAAKILNLHDEALGAINSEVTSGPIRVGLVQDFSGVFLRNVLSRFSNEHPDAQVYVKVARSAQLKRLIDEGELDIGIGISEAAANVSVRAVPCCWIGKTESFDNDVVPLVLLEHPCRFRDAALEALERSGRRYRIAVEAANLSVLHAAVDVGMGVTCRTPLFGKALSVSRTRKLPKLSKVGFAIYEPSVPTEMARRFKRVACEVLTEI